MRRLFVGLCAAAVIAAAIAWPAPGTATTPASSLATATPPPQIIRVVSRPMCSQLREHVLPAIGMLLQNDALIAKSPPIFKDYVATAFTSDPGTHGAYDTTNYDSPGRTMALQHMEKLVSPLAQNVIAIQTILQNSSLAQPSGDAESDARLKQVRDDLLKALAMQSVSLDLINGFVTTQQLGDMQHAGLEYLNQIQTPEESSQKLAAMATPTANPAFQDPNAPGLPANPYSLDLTQVPGLQVGYNPVTAIEQGLQWVRGETNHREDAVSQSVSQIAAECRAQGNP